MAHLRESSCCVRRAALRKIAAIIDVNGGESTVVDDLLCEGYVELTVLDISARALDQARRGPGPLANYRGWSVVDVLDTELHTSQYNVQHNRAVFHYLTTAKERHRYVAQAIKALKPGGFDIVGTFGPEGSDQFSEVPVCRYDSDQLHGAFGERFEFLESSIEVHRVPWGMLQQLTHCFCRRLAQKRNPITVIEQLLQTYNAEPRTSVSA